MVGGYPSAYALAWLLFVLVILALVATAAVSIAGPAFRASRIDPVGALRSE